MDHRQLSYPSPRHCTKNVKKGYCGKEYRIDSLH